MQAMLDNVMLDNAVQYSEKAPITYILAVWNFLQNLQQPIAIWFQQRPLKPPVI